MVALLISCVMVTAVLASSLTAKTSSGLADRKMVAAETIREVSSQLHGYVTGCNCVPNTGVCQNGGGAGDCNPVTGPWGPNTARAGVATWYFNAPGAGIVDSQGDVWALKNGLHTITGILPNWFSGAPYNAVLTYNVTQRSAYGGRSVQQADVNVTWTDP